MSNMSLSPALSVTRLNGSSSLTSSDTDYNSLNSHGIRPSVQIPSRPQRNELANRSPPYRIHTHHVTLTSPSHTISISSDDSSLSDENASFCLADESSDTMSESFDPIETGTRRRTSCDYFPLTFDIAQADGGHFSPTYSVQNILHDDNTVYCSGRRGTINILLKFNAPGSSGKKYRNLPCVLSQLIIRSPQQGFTAPCKEGMIFISHNPIDLKATEKFDHFTRGDFITHTATIRSQARRSSTTQGSVKDDGHEPVAWFQVKRDNQQCVDLGERSGRYVMLKLLRSENESDNIDLQYVGLMGYFGARSFAIGSLC